MKIGNQKTYTFQVMGVGKIPHLVVHQSDGSVSSNCTVDFGSVLPGQTGRQKVRVQNMSQTFANYYFEYGNVPAG